MGFAAAPSPGRGSRTGFCTFTMAITIHDEALDRAVLARDHTAMGSFLIPFPNCHCHAKRAELTCPSCGEPLRRSDGSVPRTAVAVLLGLTAAGALVGACGNTTTAVFYGPAMTSGAGGDGGTGGAGGAGGTGGAG